VCSTSMGDCVRRSIFHLVAAILLVAAALPAGAAEIRRTGADELRYVGYAQLVFEGEIAPGDYDRLLRLIDESCAGIYGCLNGIFLASPGGNLFEAMKIGRLVRKLRLETHLPSDLPPPDRQRAEATLKNANANYGCLSACFFIFVAGADRESGGVPILGIHRPSFLGDDLNNSHRMSGNQAAASAGQLRMVVGDYLKEMGVPTKYADLMFAVPNDRLRFIGGNDFAKDLAGYIPELRAWLDVKCNNLTDGREKRGGKLPLDDEPMSRLLPEKRIQQSECRAQQASTLREAAWKQLLGH